MKADPVTGPGQPTQFGNRGVTAASALFCLAHTDLAQPDVSLTAIRLSFVIDILRMRDNWRMARGEGGAHRLTKSRR
jgi:hypothetical protein